MAKNKYYVVWVGHNPGIYTDWEDAREQIEGYPGARYKGFTSSEAASKAYREGIREEETRELRNLMGNVIGESGTSRRKNAPAGHPDLLKKPAPISQRSPSEYLRFPEIDPEAWAVDASCLRNPGIMEYRCVEIKSGREIFRVGPFPKGTNNIGEFLAIVHALALMDKNNDWHTLYSDSVLAMGWIRKRQPKTTLVREPQTEKLYQLLARGVIWLRNHNWPVQILKWNTDKWGEIPADFDRK